MATPYCLAMVMCDYVHRDQATGKFTILGTFSTLGAEEYPALTKFCVYFSITDGLGPTQLRLRLVDSEEGMTGDEGGVVFEHEFTVVFDSPLTVFELSSLVTTHIPKPGLYHCELWADNELLMSRRIVALSGRGRDEESTDD